MEDHRSILNEPEPEWKVARKEHRRSKAGDAVIDDSAVVDCS
jgi:hypothetical protein